VQVIQFEKNIIVWIKIPKEAKSSTAKVQICHQYPNEFGVTPSNDLRCNFCDVLVKCDKKLFVESRRKSKFHPPS